MLQRDTYDRKVSKAEQNPVYDLFDFERNRGTLGIHCQVLFRNYEAYVGGSANASESSVELAVRKHGGA